MLNLREYQETAVGSVVEKWKKARSVLLCAATGSGKTVMGAELVRRSNAERVVWLAHRRELVVQAAAKLRAVTGVPVGVIGAGMEANPDAQIQVASIQTLLARGKHPAADLLVIDECHHLAADDWGSLLGSYEDARCVGLTATPERADGRPLGDIFDELVVAASYSELIRDGHLVPCRVYCPEERRGNTLAEDPVDAYERLAGGSLAFVFASNVKEAHMLAARFCMRGISAATIEAKTPKDERDRFLAEFAEGKLRVLTNVAALTEGVDVPRAATCILARGCDHISPYLQMAGRVLRPFAGKKEALLIDLMGVSREHGTPTEDRTYSLSGNGIGRAGPVFAGPAPKCPQCSAEFTGWSCETCGYEPDRTRRPPTVEILRRALLEFHGRTAESEGEKREVYERLRKVQLDRGYALAWLMIRYKERFGEEPDLSDVTEDEAREEYRRLEALARERGYKPGYAAARFKNTFGDWPPWEWRRGAPSRGAA